MDDVVEKQKRDKEERERDIKYCVRKGLLFIPLWSASGDDANL